MSHPTWVRGLKLLGNAKRSRRRQVAPYVGAWIETNIGSNAPLSLPVAPYVGAWIETLSAWTAPRNTGVAPYVGAWIETPC